MTIAFDEVFQILGRAFQIQGTCNTARGTTIPAAVQNLLDDLNATDPTVEIEATATGIPSALTGGQSGLSSLLSGISTFCSQYIIATVNADNPQANRTLPTALAELIKQMKANSETVDASTPGVSVSYGSSNIGTGRLIFSTKRSDGLIQENIIPETIQARVSGNGTTASIAFTGQQAAPSLLDHNWPMGSGLSTTINSISAASSLLANGDMEDEDDIANAPDDWQVAIGTIGTTISMTDVKVQTVAISGTPTSGYYRLFWINPQGQNRPTPLIAYNAEATAVQTALRTIPGLELVTVTTTGTTPNFTHTVTMTGRGGQVAEFTSDSSTLAGGTPSIAHNTTVTGSNLSFTGGKCLRFSSNGSQLTTIQQRVTLQPLISYAVSFWAARTATMAAGTLTVDLIDGDSGTVIEDAQGVANSFSFLGNDAGSGFKHSTELVSGEPVFRTPSVLPAAVYFRIRISTAIENGKGIVFDDVALSPMQSLYPGGPLFAAFSPGAGPNLSEAEAWATGDTFTITVTNDRAGAFQEWFNRNFNMASLSLLLPSNAAGSETILDSLIA